MVNVAARIVRLDCILFPIVAVVIALADTASNADAVTSTGVAYDTVVLAAVSPNPLPRAGHFREDFQAGLTPTASCMPGVFRRYVTPDHERIDDVCKHDATIVDCTSRTVTILDLKQKQYTQVSLDTVYDVGIAGMRALSDQVGATSALEIDDSTNGTRVIDGVATEEYVSVRTQTTTSPGLSVTTRDSWTYDFLAHPLPRLRCIDRAAAWLSRYGWPQQYAPELLSYFSDRFKKMSGPRDHITETGPQLPDWRIPVYGIGVRVQHQSDAPVWTTAFLIESGNVRAIRSDDPVFSVPTDVTPVSR